MWARPLHRRLFTASYHTHTYSKPVFTPTFRTRNTALRIQSQPTLLSSPVRHFAASPTKRDTPTTMEAKCSCGAVSVKVDDPELYTKRRGHICHCMNCRRTAGSAFGTNLIIETDKVTIGGEDNLSRYDDPDSLSGRVVKRFFCRTCGNPIKSETEPATQAGKVILKLGIFDKMPEPEIETFVDKSIPWVERHEGTTRYKIAMGGDKAE